MAKKFQSKILKIRVLAVLAKINYFSLYQRQKGVYKSDLSADNKTKVMNALLKDLEPFVNDLGFSIKVTRTTE